MKIAREVEEAGGSLTEMSIMIGAEELRERKGQFLLGCRLMKKYFGKKFFLVLVIPHIALVKWVMLQKLRHHCYYLTCL